MRISCSGCRVLRKGCSPKCSIRPCLQWIKSSESQANATLFLAKFYGRAGLINLINAGPDHLRPAIFRSLLYEACGRIANPIYGSVGLLWSDDWSLCQAAVEAVLKGEPITPVSAAAAAVAPSIKGYDIRHVPKDPQNDKSSVSEESSELHGVSKARSKFKRVRAEKPEGGKMAALAEAVAEMLEAQSADQWGAVLLGLSPSRESPFSHGDTSHTTESMVLVETAEAAAVLREEEMPEEAELGLDLRLGL